MRIIAGSLKGRQFKSPTGHRTHPMSDKVRGALFNTLGDIAGLRVLDAFSGSGALSFEAISRGAAHVTALDNDRSAQQAIKENSRELGIGSEFKLICASAQAWLGTSQQTYNLILLDPPYDKINTALLEQLLSRLEPNGTAVLSLPPSAEVRFAGNKLLLKKDYGDATLHYYST